MRKSIILLILILSSLFGSAQIVVTISTADSSKFKRSTGTTNAEVIIENGTRNITGGFLWNRWNGRTQFRIPVVGDIAGLQDSLNTRVKNTFISATSPIFYDPATGIISSQAASATLNGYMTTGSQAFAGAKTFSGNTYFGTGLTSVFEGSNGRLILDKLRIYNVTAETIYHDISSSATTNRTLSIPDASLTIAGWATTPINGALTKWNGTVGLLTNAVSGTDYLTPTGSAASLTSFPTLNQNTTGNSATTTLAANSTLWGGVAYGGPYLPTSGYTGSLSLVPSAFSIGNGSSVDANALTLQAANSNSLLRFKNAAGASIGSFYWDGTNMVADYSGGWKFLGPLVGTTITTTGTITAPELSVLSASNSVTNLLTSRNTSTGASARNRSRFGNDASTVALTIDVYGSGVAGNSNYVRLTNQLNAPLILGANGGDNLTINAAGTVTLSSLAASGNVIAGADNTGLLGKITIGSGLSLTSGVLTATGGASGSVTTAGGTSGKIAKFTSASNIENSIITESAGLIDVNGNITGDIVQSDIGLKFNFNAIDRGGIYGYSTILGSGTDYTPTFFTQAGLGINFSTNGVATPKMTLSSGGALNTTGAITGSNLSGTNTGDQTITLSGDITGSGTTGITTTLATVNANIGSFGSSTAIPNFTVNAKGLVTAAGSSAVIAPAGTLTGTTLASNVTASSLTSAAGGTFGSNAYTSTAFAPLASPTFTGTATTPNIIISTTPTTSIGTYDILTRNASTGAAEKITSISPTAWTPASTTPALASASGTYTKNGYMVTANFIITFPTSSSTAQVVITGFPHVAYNYSGVSFSYNDSGLAILGETVLDGFQLTNNSAANITYQNMSGKTIKGSVTYITSVP